MSKILALTIGMLFVVVRLTARAADDTYFLSGATGIVKLSEFGTNQPDVVHPIRPVTRVHLLLEPGDTGRRFLALANQHQLLPAATLNEARTGITLRLVNVRVIGFESLPSGNNKLRRLSVELSVDRCTYVGDTRPRLTLLPN